MLAWPFLRRVTDYVSAVMAVLIMSLGVALWLVWGAWGREADARKAVERELTVQAEVLAQTRLAKDVLNAHIKRMEAQDAQKDEILSELRALPGRDVPLSDLLSATVERLR